MNIWVAVVVIYSSRILSNLHLFQATNVKLLVGLWVIHAPLQMQILMEMLLHGVVYKLDFRENFENVEGFRKFNLK